MGYAASGPEFDALEAAVNDVYRVFYLAHPMVWTWDSESIPERGRALHETAIDLVERTYPSLRATAAERAVHAILKGALAQFRLAVV